MKDLLAVLLVVILAVVVVGIVLGILWGIWHLWMFVVPQLWTDGPENLLHPNFWLFVAAWFLVSFIGHAIFGGKGK